MKLHNLIEDEVLFSIDKILEDMEDICKCEICKLDIASLTLNNLKPKYVVTDVGYAYAKAFNMNQQFNSDIYAEITKAIEKIKGNPRHG